MNGKHEQDNRQLENTFAILSGKSQKFSSTIRLRNKSKKTTSASALVLVSYPGRDIKLNDQLVEDQRGEFTNTFSAQVNMIALLFISDRY